MINKSEIRFVVMALVDGDRFSRCKKGMFYRKGSWDSGRGWYESPFDATLFENTKNIHRLNHGLDPTEIQVVEVDVSMTDKFPTPGA